MTDSYVQGNASVKTKTRVVYNLNWHIDELCRQIWYIVSKNKIMYANITLQVLHFLKRIYYRNTSLAIEYRVHLLCTKILYFLPWNYSCGMSMCMYVYWTDFESTLERRRSVCHKMLPVAKHYLWNNGALRLPPRRSALGHSSAMFKPYDFASNLTLWSSFIEWGIL